MALRKVGYPTSANLPILCFLVASQGLRDHFCQEQKFEVFRQKRLSHGCLHTRCIAGL